MPLPPPPHRCCPCRHAAAAHAAIPLLPTPPYHCCPHCRATATTAAADWAMLPPLLPAPRCTAAVGHHRGWSSLWSIVGRHWSLLQLVVSGGHRRRCHRLVTCTAIFSLCRIPN